MTRSRFRTSAMLVLFGSIFLQGCDDGGSTAPSASVALHQSAPAREARPTFVVCPTTTTEIATGTIGPDGGSISVAGHRLMVPAGVLASPTPFTLRAPAGRILKLDITAGDAAHYEFSGAVAVTISYARCKRQNLWGFAAGAWHIDSATELPLSYMGGESNARRRTLTFSTNHLSTYAVAY